MDTGCVISSETWSCEFSERGGEGGGSLSLCIKTFKYKLIDILYIRFLLSNKILIKNKIMEIEESVF